MRIADLSLKLTYNSGDIFSLDTNIEYLKATQKIANKYNLPFYPIYGDAVFMPFKDNTFHGVFSNSFFEYIYDMDKTIDEQIRIIKKSGREISDLSIESIELKVVI